MTTRPILFSAPMVRANLRPVDPKTQTRRGINKILGIGKVTEFGRSDTPGYDWTFRGRQMRWNDLTHAELLARCPYGQPGDRLWVRETWAVPSSGPSSELGPDDADEVAYAASSYHGDLSNPAIRWRPSIHMPRWASRLTLKVTDVRVQRLQEISEEDAKAEGVTFDGTWWSGGNHRIKGTPKCLPNPRDAYADLWTSINGPDSWDANPWCWCISFKRIKP